MKNKDYGFFVWHVFFHVLVLTLISEASSGLAQSTPNYEEAAVRKYSLPNLLIGPNKKQARSSSDWEKTTRPFQFKLLETFTYGCRLPAIEVSVLGKEKRIEKNTVMQRRYGFKQR